MKLQPGAVIWAVVPFVPQTPLRIYAGTSTAPYTIRGAHTIIDAITRGGDAQLDYVVSAKVRPVLVLSGIVSPRYDEYLCLRLARTAKYGDAEQRAIQAGAHSTLLQLNQRTSGLREDSAAMIDSPVRVHRSAFASEAVGALSLYELRTVQERFVLLNRFDMRAILAAAQEQQRSP